MQERTYQAGLINRLRDRFPGVFILKNDSSYIQGILDLTLLFDDYWAMLEVKAYEGAPEQPNQRYYVELFDSMTFAAFIFPENEEEVLHALERSLAAKGQTRNLLPKPTRLDPVRRRQAQ